ncbi:MAG: c-type cytochrome [Chitinophagaceae bacterium]|nr:MAG: c-type cytochrome [Chitinophagaceae bacterium]
MLRFGITLSALIAVITLCSLTMPADPLFKNLKVLSKKTTHEELDSTMKSFNRALGVKCGFCHAQSKDDPKKLDFASDENKHKDVARYMMKMTTRINKKFFKEEQTPSISCVTCHNGEKEPKKPVPEPKRED